MKNEKITGVIFTDAKNFRTGNIIAFMGSALLCIGLMMRDHSTTAVYHGLDDTSHDAIRQIKGLMDESIKNKMTN